MNWFSKSLVLVFLLAGIFINPTLAAGEKVILAMGDSLMAGYNLPPNKGFPNQLEDWLVARGRNVRVINAGVSGDTSTAALARLEWTLGGAPGGRPDLFIIEIGANDMLRGIDPAVTRKNIDSILELATERDIPVFFAGMLAAPNMGPDYQQAFDSIYPDLAEKYHVDFYPFFLDGVAGNPDLNLSDGIHPNTEGVAVIVDKMGPVIEELIGD